MWKIHGNVYDLSNFLDKHPGGRRILETCQGDNDLTATFESYHAMSDINKIKKMMDTYKIGETKPSKFMFKEDGFYKTLQIRIKKLFIEQGYNHKANYFWFIKSSIQILLFIITFYQAFYNHNLSLSIRTVLSFLSGHLLIQAGFNVMHDASHFAISKNNKVNILLGDILNSLLLLDGQLWETHHVFRHHSFTGDSKLDPDTINFRPFARKTEEDNKNKYLKLNYKYPKLFVSLFAFLLPGMFFGQIMVYHIFWRFKGYIWNMSLPKEYKFTIYETFIKLIILYSFYHGQSFLVLLSYITGLNLTYSICVLPDHDTFDTYKNKLDLSKNNDWGIMQVRHSANYSNSNPIICQLFGGINYQIEHHLFPTICHIHFDKIKPIVKKTCQEFNVPYVEYNTAYEAIYSVLKTFEYISTK